MNSTQPQTFRSNGGQIFESQPPPLTIYSNDDVVRDYICPRTHVYDNETNVRYLVGKMVLVSNSLYQIILVEDPLTEEV